MPSDKQPPLPLAANRAALSNRISMLLSAQSSVLKTMNLPTSKRSQRNARARAGATGGIHDNDDDDDMWKGSRPNEGVGYVPEKGAASKDASKEDRMLRGRILGKGKGAGGDGRGGVRGTADSESEEDMGRSALGKRKRAKKEVTQDDDENDTESRSIPLGADDAHKQTTASKEHTQGAEDDQAAQAVRAAQSTEADATVGQGRVSDDEEQEPEAVNAEEKKRERNRRKKKRKKEREKNKAADEK